MNRPATRAILVTGVAYGLIGVATAVLAQHADSLTGVKFWRFTAWVLSAVVLVAHIWVANRRQLSSPPPAIEVALGGALGGFLLALGGPVYSHWNLPDRGRVLLSLLSFPLFMSVLALIAALIIGVVLRVWRPSGFQRRIE